LCFSSFQRRNKKLIESHQFTNHTGLNLPKVPVHTGSINPSFHAAAFSGSYSTTLHNGGTMSLLPSINSTYKPHKVSNLTYLKHCYLVFFMDGKTKLCVCWIGVLRRHEIRSLKYVICILRILWEIIKYMDVLMQMFIQLLFWFDAIRYLSASITGLMSLNSVHMWKQYQQLIKNVT
jgi:hypothetical protein